MSVNFSQNPEYMMQQQGNFGAGVPVPEAPHQYNMIKEMGLPTNLKETIEWMPYFLPAVGASKWISNLATNATRLNPDKNAAITALESFNKSTVSRMAGKADRFISPITTKYASQINSTKSFLSRITPKWFKNLGEKIKIGVTPRNHMALSQYKGMTLMQVEGFLDKLGKLPPDKIKALGLEPILQNVGKNSLEAGKSAIALLEKLPVKDIKAMVSAKGKNLHILEELTKSKAFLGMGGKTAVGKGIQSGFMMVSDAAGGGVVGASWIGMIMNSIFLASTIKRTWNAPWGEKLSTFMEGALVDFCGGYLMMLLGTKLTYKLLGFKNVDKTAAQLRSIKRMTAAIGRRKARHAELLTALCQAKKAKSAADIAALEKLVQYNAFKINSNIERLKIARGLQKAPGVKGFFTNMINRPLRWLGNFLSVGLENLPTNVAGQTIKKGKIKNVSVLRVFGQHFKNALKSVAGYPVRFILVAMVVTPPLTKICAKISHTLFGKPTKSIMDEREGKKDNDKANKEQNPLHVDMNAFSEYTKATGIARAIAEAQQRAQMAQQNKNVNSGYQDNFQPQMKRARDISPATYVPSSIAAAQGPSPLADEIKRQTDNADRLTAYAQKELIAAKRGEYDW